MSTEQITWRPIDSPVATLPPVDIKIEVPINATAPTDIQLRRLEGIRERFPMLWRAAMDGLQNKFNEIGESQQAPDDVLSAGVFIPESNDEENDENFYWCIGLDIRDRKLWEGWEVEFSGYRFASVMFYA